MEKQEEPREIISEKAGERKIPVFTVLKNQAILKNIFLLDSPALVEESEKELEEILVVGRHPDCNITLEHPSISRFHLRIHSKPSSQSFSVTDLSSVHGTWIAGKKIEPGVRVKLQEGDTMQLGGSSRVYRLHWIPLSCAYDFENPFVPPIQESEPVKEGEGETHPVEDGFLHEHDETLTKSDKSESLDSLYSDTYVPTMKSLTPSAPPLPEDINSPASNEEQVECKTTTYKRNHEEDEINIQHPNHQLDKEDNIPEYSFAQTHSQAESQTENAESTPIRSWQRSALSIWSTRGKASSVLIQTDRDGKKSSRVSFGSEIKSENNADADIQSPSKDLFLSGDMGEIILTPYIENHTPTSLPLGSLKNADEFDLQSESTMKSSPLNVDEVDDEIVVLDKENVTMNIHLLRGDADEEMFMPDKQMLTPNKENRTPSSVPLRSLFDLKSGSSMKSSLDEVDDNRTPNKENRTPSSVPLRSLFDLKSGSSMKSSLDEVDDKIVDEEDDKIVIPDKENVTLDVHPLSGYVDEEMLTPDKENLSPSSFPLRSLNNTNKPDLKSGSTMKSLLPNVDDIDDETVTLNKENVTLNIHFLSGDMDEVEMLTPVKENCIPSSVLLVSLKKTGEVDLQSQSTIKSSVPNMDEGDDGIVTPNKENVTLNTYLLRSIKQKGKVENITKLKVFKPSPLKNAVDPRFHRDEGVPFSLENDNCTEKVGEHDDEIFTPDKENMTPNTHFLQSMNKIGKPREAKIHTGKANEDDSLWSMNKIGKLQEANNLKVLKPSPLKIGVDLRLHQVEGLSVEKENHNEKVLQVTSAVARNLKEQGQNLQSTQKGKMGRVPFQSLLVNSSSKTESNYSTHDVSTKSIHHIKYPGVEGVYRFSMSLQEHIVREENTRWCMVVDTTTLLNKESRKALRLLQGLKWTSLIIPRIVIRELDCMKRHSSFFRRTTEVSSALEWVEDCMINTKWWIYVQSSEEDASTIVPTPPATPTSLFSHDSLLEIVSPTAEDHILEYALSLRKINNSQRLVLLSDDVTLKIKSMAEGLLCETAADFRESLVNPFSERFLWTDSSPRGTTWSSADDVVLKETYYHRRLQKPSKLGESARGLKLILLHNSHYRQFSCLNKN